MKKLIIILCTLCIVSTTYTMRPSLWKQQSTQYASPLSIGIQLLEKKKYSEAIDKLMEAFQSSLSERVKASAAAQLAIAYAKVEKYQKARGYATYAANQNTNQYAKNIGVSLLGELNAIEALQKLKNQTIE